MGFFDHEVESSFDRMFDLDRDGILDAGEQVLQMDYIMESVEGDRNAYERYSYTRDWDSGNDYDSDSDTDTDSDF